MTEEMVVVNEDVNAKLDVIVQKNKIVVDKRSKIKL